MRTRTHSGTEYEVSEAHPAAELFGWLPDEDIARMAEDIKANGQKFAIRRLPDGRVFDGRNRELACRVAGVDPQYKDEDASERDVIAFVQSANLMRRSETASQRAAIGAELYQMSHAAMEKAERDYEAGLGPKPTEKPLSQTWVAERMGVSQRIVSGAAKVLTTSPELHQRVKEGGIDVATAEKVADLPAEVRELVAAADDPKAAAHEALEDAYEELFRDAADEEEETQPAPRPEPERVSEAELAPLRTKRLPKHFVPGNHSDPDHPYAPVLNALTQLVKATNKALAECQTGALQANLVEMRKVKLPAFPWVVFLGGRIENGVEVPTKVKFTGLHLFRSLVRKSGGKRGKLNTAALMKFVREAAGESAELMAGR
jgi:hypothetical protein